MGRSTSGPGSAYRVAAMRVTADPGQVATALASLNALMSTPRSKLSKDGRRRFWVEMCEAARRTYVLRGYTWRCSAPSCWVQIRQVVSGGSQDRAERRGFEVTTMLQHAITDAVRAVQRSLGPAGIHGKKNRVASGHGAGSSSLTDVHITSRRSCCQRPFTLNEVVDYRLALQAICSAVVIPTSPRLPRATSSSELSEVSLAQPARDTNNFA